MDQILKGNRKIVKDVRMLHISRTLKTEYSEISVILDENSEELAFQYLLSKSQFGCTTERETKL